MSETNRLDEKGRCCGRKPLVYKRPPRLFCFRCDAAFDPKTGEQITNWAYTLIDGKWFARAEFDRATMDMSSRDQCKRISGRLAVRRMESEHGKEKLDAMFAELTKPKPRKRAARKATP